MIWSCPLKAVWGFFSVQKFPRYFFPLLKLYPLAWSAHTSFLLRCVVLQHTPISAWGCFSFCLRTQACGNWLQEEAKTYVSPWHQLISHMHTQYLIAIVHSGLFHFWEKGDFAPILIGNMQKWKVAIFFYKWKKQHFTSHTILSLHISYFF